MKFEFSAGGVVIKKEGQKFKFALILNSENFWTFPKGHIKKGEKKESAAIRETKEEIGLKKLKILTLLEKIDYWFKKDNILIHKYVYYYLMETSNNKLEYQQSEICDARWFSENLVTEKLKYKEDISVIKKAIDYLKIAFPLK